LRPFANKANASLSRDPSNPRTSKEIKGLLPIAKYCAKVKNEFGGIYRSSTRLKITSDFSVISWLT
jgi:hypothetical protein